KLLGFDLCPRLKALKDRHLFLPRGSAIPDSVRPICRASVDLERIRAHWDETVRLVASVHAGHTSAVHVAARYGSAASRRPAPRASTCAACSASPSSATPTRSYRPSWPRKRRPAPHETSQRCWDFAVLRGSEHPAQSVTCKTTPRNPRTKHPPATVCYCTENEGTPDFRATSAGTVLRFSRGFSRVRASLADYEICSVRSERGTVRRHFSKSAPA
ncbi:MAG: hypothetical protein QG550_2362, partial [Pseudomonadota bacterium]|nr:hypothetical protein [Pseudomonadota bacterium]